VFSNYDHKSANNICLQLLAADCLERPLRNSHSAVCERQPILASSCADLHTLNHIVVDDGIMTSFITTNSTTASPKTAELLPAAAASGYVAADCQYAQR